MKLACFFSGGKDSTYAIHLAKKQGHDVVCLLSIFAKSEESHLLHYPNLRWTKLQSESMNIPQLTIISNSNETNDELIVMEKLLQNAKEQFQIDGLVHGGIKSKFQKEKFETLCLKLNLVSIAPLWETNPKEYMNQLLDSNFHFMMVTVSSDGLDEQWLGKLITKSDIEVLNNLSDKFGFNLNFEGGESETFVINCPLFSYPIKINKFTKNWDGYRGRFEIVDAELNYNA
jgi:ABC transporter with metal-binding/Fe-S-binding domain ATP-binding protein